VYPGTSGSSFLDYVIVDKIVAPAEHMGTVVVVVRDLGISSQG